MKKTIFANTIILCYLSFCVAFADVPRVSSLKVTTKYFENVDINDYDLLVGRLETICKERGIGEPYKEIQGCLLKQFFYAKYQMYKRCPKDTSFFINAKFFFKRQLKYLERIIEFYGDLDQNLNQYRKNTNELIENEKYDKLEWIGIELNQFKGPEISTFSADVFTKLIHRCDTYKFDSAKNYENLTLPQIMAKAPRIFMLGMFQDALESSDQKEIDKVREIAISLMVKYNNRNFDSIISSAKWFLEDIDYYNEDLVKLLLTNKNVLNAENFSNYRVVKCITKMVINDPPVLEMMKRAYSDSKSSWYQHEVLKDVFKRIEYLSKKKEKDRFPDIPERYKLSNYSK